MIDQITRTLVSQRHTLLPDLMGVLAIAGMTVALLYLPSLI